MLERKFFLKSEKKKDITIKKSVLFSSTAIVILLTSIISIFSVRFYEERHPDIIYEKYFSKILGPKELLQVNQLYYLLKNNYVEDISEEELITGALKGMTNALGDPYSDYLSGDDLDQLNDSLSSSFEGIGATMMLDNEQIVIPEPPIKNSPAEKSGLQAKDIILKVDDESTEDKKLSEVVQQIRGKKGTDVKLTVQRGADIFDVTITRDVIPIDTVAFKLDEEDKHIGLIEIYHFAQNTSEEFDQAIHELREQGATSFIIDVRGNPGGLLDQVEKMSSRFLVNGTPIIQFEDKEGVKKVSKASVDLDGGDKITEPTVVLIDENSASASEIFAGALSEKADIPLIGTQTFGKGTVQTVIPLSKSGEVKLTTMKWLTPDGNWIHKEGIKPNIEADYPEYAYLTPIDISKTYQEGDSGEVIRTLNEMLLALGYFKGTAQVIYDDHTVQAIQEFQKSHQLPVTGVADKTTIIEIEKDLRTLIQQNDNAYQQGKKWLKEHQK